MNKNDIVLYAMVLFFLTVTSIMVHEGVHMLQFTLAGNEIDEVVLLGWKPIESGSAAGWVKAGVSRNFSLAELELQAHFVQILYVFFMGFALNVWAAGYRKGKARETVNYNDL